MQGDRAARDIYVTSKHRGAGHVEWSRQLSRETAPFFQPQPCVDARGALGGGERARRHEATVDMEKSAPKHAPAKEDPRDYSPKAYAEWHPKCSVVMGKSSAGREQVFGAKKHNAETMIDAFQYPGWGTGRQSAMGKAKRCADDDADRAAAAAHRSTSSLTVYTAYSPIPAAAERHVESNDPRPLGGAIPKFDARAVAEPRVRPALSDDRSAVSRHVGTTTLGKSSRLGAPKRSEQYRDLFRTAPPAPLSTNLKGRSTPGYAYQRTTPDRCVGSLLARADADRKRAKAIVAGTFGPMSRTSVRTSMLYTPSPAGSPAPDHGLHADDE
jgi:hypothetical protein